MILFVLVAGVVLATLAIAWLRTYTSAPADRLRSAASRNGGTTGYDGGYDTGSALFSLGGDASSSDSSNCGADAGGSSSDCGGGDSGGGSSD
jgi:hypothetical protein